MDILESFIDENSLTIKNVLNLVDEYSLFSHYIGAELDVQVKYSSPLREGDNDPSFSLFYGYGKGSEDKLYFKDLALDISGDVFDFLGKIMRAETLEQVLRQIDCDLGLNLGNGEGSALKPTIIKKAPVARERPKIRIVSQTDSKEYVEYWERKYDIGKPCRDYFNITDLGSVHYEYAHKTTIVVPKTLCIGYTIGEHYKVYQPFEKKEFKFRNDFPTNYIEGHMQLNWSRNDFLIITKSLKEVALFKQHWNIQAVSGKSETTFIDPYFMNMYLNHFSKVFLWLDPDEAGVKSTLKYMEMYPKLIPVNVPHWVQEKDPTDYYEVHRLHNTTEFINNMLSL